MRQSHANSSRRGPLDFPDENEPTPPSNAVLGVYSKAAVAANSEFCAEIGKSLMERGGSAVDAVIGTALCEGLCSMQNMGLGGGMVMVIYQREEGKVYALNARETAPNSATRDMFKGDPNLASQGGLSMGVPGELMGYWEAHRRFGRLPWREVVAPAAEMAANGIPVNYRLSKAFEMMAPDIAASPDLANLLIGNNGGVLAKFGERLKIPQLASTLSLVGSSSRGAWELYDGCLTQAFIDDLHRQGSIITYCDMVNYKAKWVEAVSCSLPGGDFLYSVPAPASGSLLAFILRLLKPPALCPYPPFSIHNTHLIAEAFKTTYALRSHLGDPQFVNLSQVLETKLESERYVNEVRERMMNCPRTWRDPQFYGALFWPGEDGGTANTTAIDPQGNAASATSTINTLFGSLVASGRTGIIMNNEMDDFSSPSIINSFGLPPSPSNWIEPGKQPMSSMSPALLVGRDGNVKLAVGAAGGTHITTATAQVIIRHLWMGDDLKKAVDAPRIHHQLLPMVLKYEYGLPKVVVEGLEREGHRVVRARPHSSVTAVSKLGGIVTAIYDYRRGGSTAGF